MKKCIVSLMVVIFMIIGTVAFASDFQMNCMGTSFEVIDVNGHDHSQDTHQAISFTYYHVKSVAFCDNAVVVGLEQPDSNEVLYIGAIADKREALSDIATTARTTNQLFVIGRLDDDCVFYFAVSDDNFKSSPYNPNQR
jgi:hypothetical protein